MNYPVEIKQVADRVMGISWDDGIETRYNYIDLRRSCPCASCKEQKLETKKEKVMDERYQLRVITNQTPSDDPQLVRVDWVGNYALRLVWDDGHDTGIFNFELLRQLGIERPGASHE